MADFQESGLSFAFEQNWVVRKYDVHPFFQGFSGAGLKGVDFIGLQGGRLFLFEVKNYRRRQQWQTENPFERILKAPPLFTQHIAAKAEDTLRALGAIGTYYRRKRLFRLLHPLLLRLPGRRLDWVFWARAYALLHDPARITLVLWLETEQTRAGFRRTLQDRLSDQLNPAVGDVRVMPDEEVALPGLQVQFS